MNFKRIEVFGFKSFADKVEVNFDDGITGIVGPNGCGKSNVADTIRWVLGEQSARLLRGKSMQDVIFNGTARRKPLSYCEASLVFDNSKRIFPDFEYEEVIITRKLYRSGESEYLINKTPCRLKDVQDLIRDTGLGREGYSIVGQGRIDEIVNARPKDRRSIFEDAAGILKFKQRKIESERKLARTQENIQQLDYIIKEAERILGPLEKQANDAKKFLELRDRLRVLEANEYIFKYENNDGQKKAIQAKLAGIEEEYTLKENAVKEIEEKYSKKINEQNDVDNYISQLRDRQTEMAVYAESIKGQGSTLSERISQLKSQRKDYADRIVSYEEEIDKKSIQLDDFCSRLNMENEDKADKEARLRALDREYLGLVGEIASGERMIEESNSELLKAIESIGEIKADLGKLGAERDISLARIAELKQEIEDVKSRIESDERLKRNYEESVERFRKDKSKLAQNKNEVMVEVAELKAKVEKAREDAKNLMGSIQSFEMKCKILTDLKNEYGSFGGAVQRLMQASKKDVAIGNRIQGLVAELISVPKELETAIEMALGNNMQNIVTEDEEDAKYLIEYLKVNRLGRVTFLPMTAYKPRDLESVYMPILREKGCLGIASKLISYDDKYYNIFSGLLGRTLICEDMDCAVAISKKYRYAVKIVTLQGDVINTTGSMTGGSKKSDSSNILSQEREIENATKMLAKAKENYANAMRIFKQGNEELEELQAQLSEYEEEVKNAEVAYATENGKLDKVVSKLGELLDTLHNRTTQKEILEAKVKYIDEAIANIDRKGMDVQGAKINADDEAIKRKAEFDAKKKRKDELTGLITDVKVKISTIESEIESLNANIERVQGEIAGLKESLANAKKIVASLDEKIYQTENNLNTAVVSEEDKKQYQALIDKINSLDDYKKKLSAEILSLNADKDALSKEILSLSEAKIKQQNALEKIDELMTALQIHIAEEYNLDYDGCLLYKQDDFDPITSQSEINKLKREKNALGAVNIDAIEQFRIEGEIYAERKLQRDDMQQTADDLKKIIAEMAKEMKTRFDSEFQKINANFSSVFKELFGGGNGKLVVEDVEEGEDPLEAGIEIYAELPGKTLKSLTLYSGGEKALIAIAILFAILKLKPMPFCVLDEIEAALDDANVGLFAKYLSRFSKGTQFIVITHRKPTMELADRLYGVTMQEKGVSKMVSVSLAEAVKHSEASSN